MLLFNTNAETTLINFQNHLHVPLDKKKFQSKLDFRCFYNIF